jgi:drug/metabolite transporter (DMT)-like permease
LFVAFTPLLAPFFKRRPGWNEWLAVAVSLAGLLLLTGGTTRLNWGDLITLLAALTYALHVLLTDRLADDTINPFRLIFQQFLVIFLCSLMMALIFDLPLGVGSMNAWWVVIFLAIFPTASGFVIQLWGQRVVPPTRTALIFALEPVFAAMFAWTVGGEVVTVNKTLGGLLIVGAMMISTAPPRFKRE